jgi:hypothetical protein
MSGRRCIFRSHGLRCNAEEKDGEWIVIVSDVTVARAPDLARAIEEATGGLISGEAASKAATSIRERLQYAA